MAKVATKMNMTGFALLLLPVLMVKLMALTLGIGALSESMAAQPQVVSPIIMGPGPEQMSQSERLHKAIEHIDHLRGLEVSGNPLLYGANAARETTSISSPAQTHTLQMIMTTPNGNVALISGVQYRQGDLLQGTKWEITGISNQLRQVEFRHQDKLKEVVLGVE